MKLSVIIPMYNESSIIEGSVRTFDEYLSSNSDDYELIFADDGSTDGCGDAVLEYAKDHPRVKLCRYEKNRGKGCAVRTGILEACGDIRIFTDCDVAFGTSVIGQAVSYFEEHPEKSMVVGSRNLSKDGYEGYTFIRKLASKTYIKVLGVLGGFRLSDSQCGIKGFRGDAAEQIFSRCETDGFAFDFEAIMTASALGYGIGEMPVKIVNHRESKVHVFSDAIKMTSDVIKIRRRVKKKRRNEKAAS
ncbi:MAG: glycosyltransferase [Clostridia bacterium]|nr:glycosyltransferase [Clostridia bacterium]